MRHSWGVASIVCLHGLGRTPADWDAVLPDLEKLGPVAAPRLPNDPKAALLAAQQATPDGSVVIAHSMGGVLALRMAKELGRTYSALVLSGDFFPPARNGRSTAASLNDYLRHRAAFLRERRSRDRSSGGEESSAAALGSLARLGLRRARFDEYAAAVKGPVFVLHCRDDHYVPVDFAIAAAKRRPGWKAEILQSGGHLPQVTAPRAWLDAAMPWIGMTSGAGEPGGRRHPS